MHIIFLPRTRQISHDVILATPPRRGRRNLMVRCVAFGCSNVLTKGCVVYGLIEIRRLKELWRRIEDSARKDIARFTRETNKTGGRQAPKELSDSTLLIKDLINNDFDDYSKETNIDVDHNSEEGDNTNIEVPVQEPTELSNDDNINDDDGEDDVDVILKPFPHPQFRSTPAIQTKRRFPCKR
ncbi:hypothetical protein LOTGIDRAFT_155114 [Lottia gigantea]|uniref:Uncharacterized protein n=1 Tax=Lottia gigantea TaxID=225164 RepID=V4B9J9_LOTGI|nr:hypothetical protein LOTGIDRAFT_155114 [Lottia gigantea]ESO85624.1 hypothetical protein LOTGIDRAFT_155114 [Lottia gigantea]